MGMNIVAGVFCVVVIGVAAWMWWFEHRSGK